LKLRPTGATRLGLGPLAVASIWFGLVFGLAEGAGFAILSSSGRLMGVSISPLVGVVPV
jgi:hypothetical protein